MMPCTDVHMYLFCCILVLFTSFEGLRIYSYLVRGLMVCRKSLSSSPRIIIVCRCWEGSETLTLKFRRMFLTEICLLRVQYFSLAFWGILTCLFSRNAYLFCMLCNFKRSLLLFLCIKSPLMVFLVFLFSCFTSLEGLRT